MNETLTKEAVELLKQLQTAGQTGFIVLLVVMIATVITAVWLVTLQRQTIKKLNLFSKESEQRIREIDTAVKAADSARLESRENQKLEQTLLKDQLEAVLKVNDGFRQDIQRLNQKQDDLRKSVRETLDIGLQQIKEKLYEVSVKEILTEIPATFRADLETELTGTAERVMKNVVSKLKESPDDLIDVDAIQLVAEKTGEALLRRWEHYLNEWTYRLRDMRGMSPHEWEEYARRHRLPPGLPGLPLWDDRTIEMLAERIAHHLRRW